MRHPHSIVTFTFPSGKCPNPRPTGQRCRHCSATFNRDIYMPDSPEG